MSVNDYLTNSENIPITMLGNSKGDEDYLQQHNANQYHTDTNPVQNQDYDEYSL